MTGKLIPLGYTARGAEARLAQVLHDPNTFILDIRYSTRSHIPQWNKNALQFRWGNQYWPLSCLGNVNYKHGGPIEISNPALGIPLVTEQLARGFSFVLLCACLRYDTCHRKVVVDLVHEAMPEVEVVL